MFKIGDKVIHKKYGEGIIIEDKEETCRKNEVLVKFKEHLPISKINMHSKYSGFTNYEDTDIIDIKDLKSFTEMTTEINFGF